MVLTNPLKLDASLCESFAKEKAPKTYYKTFSVF